MKRYDPRWMFLLIGMHGCVHLDTQNMAPSAASANPGVAQPCATPSSTGCIKDPAHQGVTNSTNDIQLGPGDQIDIRFYDEDSLNRVVVVDATGNIFLPLSSDKVNVTGLTVQQVREEVVKKMSKYMKNPQIDINPVKLTSRRFYVMGEVKTPGMILLDRSLTVQDAIYQSGGFTLEANEEKVIVFHKENNGFVSRMVNLEITESFSDPEEAAKNLQEKFADRTINVQNGDIIYVVPRFLVSVERFMTEIDAIVNPAVNIQRGIINTPDMLDVLRGKDVRSTNVYN